MGASGDAWLPQITPLAGEFETLRFDNRGLGRSVPCQSEISIAAMAQDARELLDAADWASAHVVGHSMGGVIAQQLALDCPERVRSLSLLCTFPRGKDAARPTLAVLWMTLRTRLGSRRMRQRAFLEILLSREYLGQASHDELSERLAGLLGRDLADQPPILMAQLRALARHDCSARLAELGRIPTLVVSAELDSIALPQYGRRLVQLIPGARYEEMPQVRHGAPIEKAAEVNAMLGRFLTECELAGSLRKR